ncbi:DUF2306 domain-containing protein [Lentzea flaviverrucosa]|uniref:Uncharacterized membrane protein n=1 Tax=Lentzea flaviverrucosa TaxID=200379 RepID=A0A1H9W8D4_9PSEU|nr:DUF2306 domain-containing protein [Lentzea flaviverrucosa]RDI22307.1 putative membrane protein [Lentzea flaviverrucosa]SES30094.1 Uncharacterized membrane protein [Lentzea flaviverrucosa]
MKTSRGYAAWLAVSGLVCVAITIFAASAYVTLDMSQSRPPLHGPVHYGLLIAHIFTGTVAVLAGVSQFWPGLRRRHPRVHRVMGRVYFAAVLPSSVLGVVCAQLSLAGLASSAPLTVLSALWFVSAVYGLKTARRRQFGEHRIWMIRGFALTGAAVTGRLWGLALGSLMPDGDGLLIFATANWLSFVVNLLVAEWWIQSRGYARTLPSVALRPSISSRSAQSSESMA